MLFSILFAIIAGALGRRIAGGVLNTWFAPTGRVMGDTPARLIYGALVALAGFVGGASLYMSLAMIVAVWIGTTTGNFDSMAMGRGPTSALHDWLGMTAHAFLSTLAPVLLVISPTLLLIFHGATPSLLLNGVAWWYVAGFTVIAAPLYDIGWIITGKSGSTMSLPLGFNLAPEIGEGLWGASCAVGTFLTFALATGLSH